MIRPLCMYVFSLCSIAQLFGHFMIPDRMPITADSPLIICMDINGTVMAEDSAEGQDFSTMIIKSLAGWVRAQWQEGYPEMSYRQMVNDVWAKHTTGEEKNVVRKQCYDSFMDRLRFAAADGKITLEIFRQVEQAYTRAIAMQEYYKHHTLFPSFIHLIKVLRSQGVPFKLIYRTFGEDYTKVAEAVRVELPDFQVTVHGAFKGAALYMNGQLCTTFSQAIDHIPLNGAAFIQDDYRYWTKNGEKPDFGKPMPIKDFRCMLFFDDNINVRHIVNICSDDFIPTGMHIATEQQRIGLAMAIQVDMCQAMTDPAFFVNKVASYFDHLSSVQN